MKKQKNKQGKMLRKVKKLLIMNSHKQNRDGSGNIICVGAAWEEFKKLLVRREDILNPRKPSPWM